jgi:hypothetical protein
MARSPSEIGALLDAHDGLVCACLEGGLSLREFVAAYGDFPRNAGLAPDHAMFGRRIAFHQEVAKIVSSVSAGPEEVLWPLDETGGFLAKAVILRLRQLIARPPDFKE